MKFTSKKFQVAYNHTSAPKVIKSDIRVSVRRHFNRKFGQGGSSSFASKCVALVCSKYSNPNSNPKHWIIDEAYNLYLAFVLYQYRNQEEYDYDYDGLIKFTESQDTIGELRRYTENIIGE